MTYKVTVMKDDGCWYTLAEFDTLAAARNEVLQNVEDYGLANVIIEVVDGGRH